MNLAYRHVAVRVADKKGAETVIHISASRDESWFSIEARVRAMGFHVVGRAE